MEGGYYVPDRPSTLVDSKITLVRFKIFSRVGIPNMKVISKNTPHTLIIKKHTQTPKLIYWQKKKKKLIFSAKRKKIFLSSEKKKDSRKNVRQILNYFHKIKILTRNEN